MNTKKTVSFSENLKRLRKEKNFTQKELGDLCSPRIAESTIRRYELGLLNPKFETKARIASALGVSLSDLDPASLIDLGIEEAYPTGKRCPVGGVDRTRNVDAITIQMAVETPFWMAVWAAEPDRQIDVRMSYGDLKIICDLIDARHKAITGGTGGDNDDGKENQ